MITDKNEIELLKEGNELEEFLTDMGNAIREAKGSSELVKAKDMPTIVRGMNNGEGSPEIDSLDESLLVESNIGKTYRCKGRTYKIVNRIPESLEGMTVFVPQGWTEPNDLPEYDWIYGATNSNEFPYVEIHESFFEGDIWHQPLLILFRNGEILFADENGNENIPGWRFVEHPCFAFNFKVLVEDYDYTNLIKWFISNNARFDGKKYGIIFEDIDKDKGIEVESLDESLLIQENQDKVYKYNNELYRVISESIPGPLYNELWNPLDYYATVPAGWTVPSGYSEFYANPWEDYEEYQIAFGGVYDDDSYIPLPVENIISMIDFNTGDIATHHPDEELTFNIREIFNMYYSFEALHILQWLIDNNAKFEGRSVCSFKIETSIPIEVEELNDSLLVKEDDGKIYKCGNNLYQVEKIKSLKGLTIKFNEHVGLCNAIKDYYDLPCNGIIMGLERNLEFIENNIGKNFITNVWGEESGFSFFSLITESWGRFVLFYDTELNKWIIGSWELDKVIIYNFDCPKLNERRDFIDWVLANAQVYSKIEDINEIDSFKFDFKSSEEMHKFALNCIDAMAEINAAWPARYNHMTVDGKFIVEFESENEVVNKKFSKFTVDINNDSLLCFSNDSGDVLSFKSNNEKVVVEYNGVTLKEAPIFKKFNCKLNGTYWLIYGLLAYGDLSSNVKFTNGCIFKEYLVPNGILSSVNSNNIYAKNYEKVNINPALFRGDY